MVYLVSLDLCKVCYSQQHSQNMTPCLLCVSCSLSDNGSVEQSSGIIGSDAHVGQYADADEKGDVVMSISKAEGLF